PGDGAMGQEGDGRAEAGALERARDVQHLAHARPASRAFVPDHDEIARLDLSGFDGAERVLFAVEHAGPAAEDLVAVTGELGHATIGRQVALEDREPSLTSEGIGQRPNHLLARRFTPRARRLADRPA